MGDLALSYQSLSILLLMQGINDGLGVDAEGDEERGLTSSAAMVTV